MCALSPSLWVRRVALRPGIANQPDGMIPARILHALDIVKSLNGVRFDWKETGLQDAVLCDFRPMRR